MTDSISVGCYRQWIFGMSEINEMIYLPIEKSKSATRKVLTLFYRWQDERCTKVGLLPAMD